MKTKVSFFFLSLLTALAVSCGPMETPLPILSGEEEEFIITLSSDSDTVYDETKSAFGEIGSAIENANIWVTNGEHIIAHHFISGTNGISVSLTKGYTYTIYALTNAKGDMANAVSTVAELKAFRFDMDMVSASKNFPMAGSITVSPTANSTRIFKLRVKRLFSKVVLKVSPDEAMQNQNVTITKVQLKNNAYDVTPFTDNSYTKNVVADLEYATEEDLATLNAGGQVEFYCMENCCGTTTNPDRWKKLPDSAPYGKPTYVEMTAHVDGFQMSGDIIYRFCLGANNTNDYNLKRNTIYTITINTIGTSVDGSSDKWKIDSGDVVISDGEAIFTPNYIVLRNGGPSQRVEYRCFSNKSLNLSIPEALSSDITDKNLTPDSNNLISGLVKLQAVNCPIGTYEMTLCDSDSGKERAKCIIDVTDIFSWETEVSDFYIAQSRRFMVNQGSTVSLENNSYTRNDITYYRAGLNFIKTQDNKDIYELEAYLPAEITISVDDNGKKFTEALTISEPSLTMRTEALDINILDQFNNGGWLYENLEYYYKGNQGETIDIYSFKEDLYLKYLLPEIYQIEGSSEFPNTYTCFDFNIYEGKMDVNVASLEDTDGNPLPFTNYDNYDTRVYFRPKYVSIPNPLSSGLKNLRRVEIRACIGDKTTTKYFSDGYDMPETFTFENVSYSYKNSRPNDNHSYYYLYGLIYYMNFPDIFSGVLRDFYNAVDCTFSARGDKITEFDIPNPTNFSFQYDTNSDNHFSNLLNGESINIGIETKLQLTGKTIDLKTEMCGNIEPEPVEIFIIPFKYKPDSRSYIRLATAFKSPTGEIFPSNLIYKIPQDAAYLIQTNINNNSLQDKFYWKHGDNEYAYWFLNSDCTYSVSLNTDKYPTIDRTGFIDISDNEIGGTLYLAVGDENEPCYPYYHDRHEGRNGSILEVE